MITVKTCKVANIRDYGKATRTVKFYIDGKRTNGEEYRKCLGNSLKNILLYKRRGKEFIDMWLCIGDIYDKRFENK